MSTVDTAARNPARDLAKWGVARPDVVQCSSRRSFLKKSGYAAIAAASVPGVLFARTQSTKEFDVRSFGAIGDGLAVDTKSIQRAIDEAAAGGGGKVILRGGKRFLSGALLLRSGVDFHLADDALLLANPNPSDYGAYLGLLNANGTQGLRISGTGKMDGQGMKFVTSYSDIDQRWEPMKFRPRMFELVRSNDLQIEGITFGNSPEWGMHLLGCERVLIDGVRIRNYMDVPNCDGIDPDHCRDMEIRNCDIVCADDGIVIKTSEQAEDYGPCRNIRVSDCVVTTRDSGLKIGTETVGDISKILFERCKVVSGGRGPTITHRQAGNIEDVEFRDIEVVAEHHASRWWGWGEAISITAWPRTPHGKVGSLKDIRLRNITARAENSVRIDGMAGQPIQDVLLDNVHVTIDRWTDFPGAHFDNRPTAPGVAGLEPHDTPAFSVRHAANVTLQDCSADWGKNRQDSWSQALQTEDVTGLKLERFRGEAAFPKSQKSTTTSFLRGRASGETIA